MRDGNVKGKEGERRNENETGKEDIVVSRRLKHRKVRRVERNCEEKN